MDDLILDGQKKYLMLRHTIRRREIEILEIESMRNTTLKNARVTIPVIDTRPPSPNPD